MQFLDETEARCLKGFRWRTEPLRVWGLGVNDSDFQRKVGKKREKSLEREFNCAIQHPKNFTYKPQETATRKSDDACEDGTAAVKKMGEMRQIEEDGKNDERHTPSMSKSRRSRSFSREKKKSIGMGGIEHPPPLPSATGQRKQRARSADRVQSKRGAPRRQSTNMNTSILGHAGDLVEDDVITVIADENAMNKVSRVIELPECIITV